MRMNRRQFGSLALLGAGDLLMRGGSALPAQLKRNSTLAGIPIGCDSYSFRDRDLEEALLMTADIGFGTVELWYDHIEFGFGGRTERKARDELRQWRLSVPVERV